MVTDGKGGVGSHCVVGLKDIKYSGAGEAPERAQSARAREWVAKMGKCFARMGRLPLWE